MMLSTIDDAQRKQIALRVILFSILFLHVAGAYLIYSATNAKLTQIDGETIRLMFSSIMTAVPWCLLLLISDKFVDALGMRLTGQATTTPPAVVKETKITETIPQPPTTTDIPGDAQINVGGNATVNGGNNV